MIWNKITSIYIMLVGVAYACIAFLLFEWGRRRKQDKEFKEFILAKIKDKEEK